MQPSTGEAESFEYLESLYHRPITRASEVGLRRGETLLRLLGDPHRAFPSVHVTGTCGKGSTSTMIGAVLDATGRRTGLFRSPHMENYRERMAIGTQMISVEDWLTVFARVRDAAERMERGEVEGYEMGRISLFEMMWAMAATYFAESRVDFVVAEVGMGGRLDPTNVLASEVAVVTNISLDHTAILGPDEVAIAGEKAQIIKSGSAATSAATQPAVLDLIRERSREVGAPFWHVGTDVSFQIHTHDLGGERISVHTPVRDHPILEVGLIGGHQVLNAATAVSAIDLLTTRGFDLSEDAIRTGLRAARIPGRFEILEYPPTIVLDGARNVASAEVLAETMRDLFPGRAITLLIGVLGDKDAEGLVQVLAPLARSAIVTQPPYEGRTSKPDRLVRPLRSYLDKVDFDADPASALDRAVEATDRDGIILVTGSLYLVAAVRHELLGRYVPIEATDAAAAS
jgi:dihydrofolate synthase/folylpolyglutamate synthase